MTVRDRLESDAAAWEAEGREIAEVANSLAMVIVAGEDTRAAAVVALGLGREQARRRRVAIADLVGEIPPLQQLVTDDDPHGIVDSFTHGVSLTKIARQIDTVGNLFILPSGSQPLDHAALLRHDRWSRLGAGFRDVEALLVLVLPAGAPGLDALAALSDGVIAVGRHAALRALPNVLVTLAPAVAAAERGTAGARAPGAERTTPVPAADALPEGWPAEAVGTPPAVPPAQSEPLPVIGGPPRGGTPWLWIALGVVLLAIAAFVLLRNREPAAVTTVPGAETTPPAPTTASREADGQIAAVYDSRLALPIVNPGDSAAAARFAVELTAANTESSAWRRLQNSTGELPASTVTPVVLDDQRWYKVVSGAYARSSDADSLMRALRANGGLEAGAGRLLSAPLALRVEQNLSPTAAAARVRALRNLSIGAYALAQSDGRAHVYVGAFEIADQASALAESLQGAGLEPVLSYRTGRMF